MKEKKKVKGGKRAGAGRKPTDRKKEAITVYTDTSRFGGKAGTRKAIYDFLGNDDAQHLTPAAKKEIKPIKIKDLTKPMIDLKPQDEPMTKFEQAISETAKNAILKQIEAIKAEKCPKERDTVFGRKSWQMDQDKRIKELENQLK